MSTEEKTGMFFAILLGIGLFALIAIGLVADPVRQSTSNYWKTEIVRRGYGTWETTPDGQVWFKWKENNTIQP